MHSEATDYNPSIRIATLYDYDHVCTWDIAPYNVKFLSLSLTAEGDMEKCPALTLNILSCSGLVQCADYHINN